MGSETEPAKLLLPYLQRADELQKHEPLVAYYCRLYAMERGLNIPPKERTKMTNSLLVSLMNQLEKDKKSIKLGPDDHLHVEGFALNVFTKADKQDRAGRADLNTAKTFYAASIFFEILNQFGELQPDLEQKQKYATWKAADIRKALKEGRRPVPGPPEGEKDLSIPSDTATSAYDLGQSESFPTNQQGVDTSQFVEKINRQPSTNTPNSPSSYGSADYPSNDFQQPPPANRPETSAYSQPYHHQSSHESLPHQSYSHESPPHQSYSQESSQTYHSHEQWHPTPQTHPSHENPTSTFPSHQNPIAAYNFTKSQSYPSFSDTSLPTTPGHYPYYQESDANYSNESGITYSQKSCSPSSNYPSRMQYNSGNGSGRSGSAPPTSSTFHYDPNYQPPPDKVAEAHKAARFAVGALAFDDVSVAVDFLRRSLELLTNPSANH